MLTRSGAVGQPRHLFRAGVAVSVLFRGLHFDDDQEGEASSDELLFRGRGLFQLSSVAGVFGGSRFDSRGIFRLFDGFDWAGGVLHAAGGRDAICAD